MSAADFYNSVIPVREDASASSVVHMGVASEPWMKDAACLEEDPDLWFPEYTPSFQHRRDMALKVCATCRVRAQCLEYAKRNHEVNGIWGGVDFGHRRRRRGEDEPCTVDGCARRAKSCGLCSAHKTRVERGLDLTTPIRVLSPKATDDQRTHAQAMLRNGYTVQEVAAATGLTVRQVRYATEAHQ